MPGWDWWAERLVEPPRGSHMPYTRVRQFAGHACRFCSGVVSIVCADIGSRLVAPPSFWPTRSAGGHFVDCSGTREQPTSMRPRSRGAPAAMPCVRKVGRRPGSSASDAGAAQSSFPVLIGTCSLTPPAGAHVASTSHASWRSREVSFDA